MGKLSFPVYEVNTRILDVVAKQVINSVIDKLNLWAYFRDNVYLKGDRFAISTSENPKGGPRVSTDRVDVNIEPILNPANVKWPVDTMQNMTAYWHQMSNRLQEVPLFWDKDADVIVQESQMPTALVMEFTMKFNTPDGGQRAMDALLTQFRGDGTVIPHDLVYSYPASMELLCFLREVYNKRFPNPPDKFIEYVQGIISGGAEFGVDFRRESLSEPVEKQGRQFVIRRRQIGAVGVVEFPDNKPESEKSNQYLDRTVVRFMYTIQFARPVEMWATFPAVINNQLLPIEFFPDEETSTVDVISGYYTSRSINRFMTAYYSSRQSPTYLVRFPYYDDWVIPGTHSAAKMKFVPLWSIGITLDDGDTTTVDLKDVSGYQLHPRIRQLVELHAQRNELLLTSGLYNVTVFVNDLQINLTDISVSDDLIVSFTATDRLKRYHLVFSEATDASRLNPFWLNELVKNRCFFPSTIAENLKILVDRGAYRITSTHKLLSAIRTMLGDGSIDAVLYAMILDGLAPPEIWQYTLTAEQLVAYLSLTKSTHAEHINCYLYEIFVEKLVELDYIQSASDVPPRQLTPVADRLSYGGSHGCNTPFRIFNADITTTR